MKSVIIIRHAKSSWDSSEVKDFDRPLNERGKKDAEEMAKRLFKKINPIDVFISSPARRAKDTAEIFAKLFNTHIIYVDSLYHANSNAYPEIISKIEEKYNTVTIFSHNPGITDFVNSLTKNIKTDNVPTCGMFGVQVKTEHWIEFESAKKEFLFYDYPKLGR